MTFLPIDLMWRQVDGARGDSDDALYLTLLSMGEMVLKLTAAGLVAAVKDVHERHQYAQVYQLVRADGLGEWSSSVGQVLRGPGAASLHIGSQDVRTALMQRHQAGMWQYDAVAGLHSALALVDPSVEGMQLATSLYHWFELFPRLRNSTRGHGAPTASARTGVCFGLEHSIRLITENFTLFEKPWAYLHRNLSGKFRVVKLTEAANVFDYLKSISSETLDDGVYISFDPNPGPGIPPSLVDLVETSIEASDFFFPNGKFNGKRYELLSYHTGSTKPGEAAGFLVPPGDLPRSETAAFGQLVPQGQAFGNLPSPREGYVGRTFLESELISLVLDDRHPIVTLTGRGGIGKTWLALSVLHEVSKTDRFTAIIWFSARDIDLLPEGPKQVTPDVLTEQEISQQLVALMEPEGWRDRTFDPMKYTGTALEKGLIGPALFVFDNFETVQAPAQVYTWIDTYLRLPNKVLITTRSREFKGDYPVVVQGMTESEFHELVNETAQRLGISISLSSDDRSQLFQESGGHPYVVKVLLGEAAKSGAMNRVEHLVAGREDILEALFERTYSTLTPLAKRAFLTLCRWRSVVPQVALEAVLVARTNEIIDVGEAAEELLRASFIERSVSSEDEETFLSVPLVAALFGRRKLSVSPLKSAVDADREVLQLFGATQAVDVEHGIGPRVERLFRQVSAAMARDSAALDQYKAILEFIARRHPGAWLRFATLYEERGEPGDLESALDAVRHYLEGASQEGEKRAGWVRVAELARGAEDVLAEAQAVVELAELPSASLEDISNATNRINQLLASWLLPLDTDEQRILLRRLRDVFEARLVEADATDCSRVGWLCWKLGDPGAAGKYAEVGLEKDSNNRYCLGLMDKLTSSGELPLH